MQYESLVIVGNGFDVYCGLPTELKRYQNYFNTHYVDVMQELGLNYIDGESPFHVAYGKEIIDDSYEFWCNYEERLALLDIKRLRKLTEQEQADCLDGAYRLSQTIFKRWITEAYQRHVPDYIGRVQKNAFFINFNYTPTLEQYFEASDSQIHYIHGNIDGENKVIVGHNVGGRVRPRREWYGDSGIGYRLYCEENYLYETDKKSNWIKLRMTRNNVGNLSPRNGGASKWSKFELSVQSIRQIVVLGHSLNPIDLTYFNYIHRKTKENNPVWIVSWYKDEDLYNAYHLKAMLRIPDTLFIVDKLPEAASSVVKLYPRE